MGAPLVAVVLLLLAVAPASAADGTGDTTVSDRTVSDTTVSVGPSDTLRVVSGAQSELDADLDAGSDRRLVDRASSERIDAVVIALWTIAAVMTALLGVFLWHTSPRRRQRLADSRSAELSEEAGGSTEASEDESAEGESDDDVSGEDSAGGDSGWRLWVTTLWGRTLPRTRLRRARRQDSGSAGEDSQQEPVEESEDDSAVWRFREEDAGERPV